MKLIKKILLATLFFFGTLTFVSAQFSGQYPEFCSEFNRLLKQGDTGNDVRRLQVLLGQEGIAYLGATGYYGGATTAAVKTFQRRNGIYPAGKVGPQTFRLMKNLWCSDGNYIQPNQQVQPEVSINPISSLGNNITISWNTRAVENCSIQKDNEFPQSVQVVGEQVYTLYSESNFTLKCSSSSGREYSKKIIVRPNQSISNLPWVNLTISPTQVIVGQQATLNWVSQNTTYCTSNIPGYFSNLKPAGTVSVAVNLGLNTFTVTCYNQAGQSVSQTITATTSTNNNQSGQINFLTYTNGLISWNTANVNSCTLSGGNLPIVSVPTTGNYSVAIPTVNSTWTLSCIDNNGQSVIRQVNYNIYTTSTATPHITADFSTDLQSYRNQLGQTLYFYCPANVTLSSVWGTDTYSDDSSVCSAAIHAGKISQTGGGYISVIVGGPQNLFVATNRNGVSSIGYTYWPGSFTFSGINQTLSPLINSFTYSNNQFAWNSSNTNTCTISGLNIGLVNVSTSGTYAFGNLSANTTYTLTCSSSNSQSVVATLLAPSTTSGTITVNVTANPSQVFSGQQTTLNWTSTNSSYCSIVGGSTNANNQNISGSYLLSPTQSANYSVTCYGNNGQSASASIYIAVMSNSGSNSSPNAGTNMCVANNVTYSHNQLITVSPYSAWLPTRCCNGLFWGPIGNIFGAPECSDPNWAGQQGHAF